MNPEIIIKLITVLAISFNLIGALLLSIPTVGGALYIEKVTSKLKRIFKSVSTTLGLIAIAVLILFFIVFSFGLDVAFFWFNDDLRTKYENAVSTMSTWETIKYTAIIIMKYIFYVLAVILSLSILGAR